MKNRIRVFISYSHKDKDFVKNLVDAINSNNQEIDVVFDNDLKAGLGFHDQIKELIAGAHLFMPIMTLESSQAGWVHQEIGYAAAYNIPVLPVTTENQDPQGLIQIMQGIKIDIAKDNLAQRFNYYTFEHLINDKKRKPLFFCAHLPEERTCMMAEYATNYFRLGKHGMVRQKGGLSSFHIPEAAICNPEWALRYYPEKKNDFHKRNQRQERLALTDHASKKGFKIIINPSYAIKGKHPDAARSRIESLISFLEKTDVKPAVVALIKQDQAKQSLTIVGDLFLAESVSFTEGDGFTNTFFTRDAAEISNRIEDFECELEIIMKNLGWTEENSLEKAIEELKRISREEIKHKRSNKKIGIT
jgi:hypothetical protein